MKKNLNVFLNLFYQGSNSSEFSNQFIAFFTCKTQEVSLLTFKFETTCRVPGCKLPQAGTSAISVCGNKSHIINVYIIHGICLSTHSSNYFLLFIFYILCFIFYNSSKAPNATAS